MPVLVEQELGWVYRLVFNCYWYVVNLVTGNSNTYKAASLIFKNRFIALSSVTAQPLIQNKFPVKYHENIDFVTIT